MAYAARRFLPFITVQRYFYAWRDSGVWQTNNHVLLMDVREATRQGASPTTDVIDSLQRFSKAIGVGLLTALRLYEQAHRATSSA